SRMVFHATRAGQAGIGARASMVIVQRLSSSSRVLKGVVDFVSGMPRSKLRRIGSSAVAGIQSTGHSSEMRYKKGRPSSGPLREESLEQPFNVGALNKEGGVQ